MQNPIVPIYMQTAATFTFSCIILLYKREARCPCRYEKKSL